MHYSYIQYTLQAPISMSHHTLIRKKEQKDCGERVAIMNSRDSAAESDLKGTVSIDFTGLSLSVQ